MRTLLTLQDLELLAADREGPLVSIYMPAVQAGRETRQNRIRFKNLVGEAEEALAHSGLRPAHARTVLSPLRALEEDDAFWQHQEAGLAVFQAAGLNRLYRLPLPFSERVVVGAHFHLKPLFRLLQGDGRFFLAALSLRGVRLFQGTRYQLEELEVPDLPQSVRDALQWDTPEGNRQQHALSTPDRGAPRAGGSAAPVSFGMGEEVGDRHEPLLQYFHAVDKALHGTLKDERAPLLLAGLDHLLPLFREANSYPHLLDGGEPLVVNPQALSSEELHREAWKRIEPLFSRQREERAGLMRQLSGTPRVTKDLTVVLPAASDGRIETLWVVEDEALWGRYDRVARTAAIHAEQRAGDEDLLDTAAVLTLLHGGTVYSQARQDLPTSHVCAALLRW